MASSESRSCELVGKNVGYKISRVRWKPQPSGAIRPSEYFATGSWDDEVNCVAVWHYDPAAPPSPPGSSAGLIDPHCECEIKVEGDVMDMQFLDREKIVVCLSTGSVCLLRFRPAHKSITLSHKWECLHHMTSAQPCPATAVTTCGVTVATGGEDGRINILHPDKHRPLQIIDTADNSTVTGLVSNIQTELLSSSFSGQLKLWDLRKPGNSPARILVVADESYALQCLDRCPHQPHLVAVGRGNGSVCFWDLRQDKQPVTIFQAHSSDVWELKFHRLHPNHLFTCSQDCSLWHWDASPSLPHSFTPSHPQSTPDSTHSLSSPWLSGAVAQGKADISNLLPNNKLSVNSLDVESCHVACGTDSEMLFLVPNMTFR